MEDLLGELFSHIEIKIPVPPVVGVILLVLADLALIIGGLFYGLGSHTVAYQSPQGKDFVPYFVSSGITYLQVHGSSTYYVINENDFSPSLNLQDAFANNQSFSFVARSNSDDLDVTFTDGIHLQGKSYQVVNLTFFAHNGTTTQFATSEFKQNPRGYYENHWPEAILVLLIGSGIFFGLVWAARS
ncbi:MAG TPA: hypothetical protein VGF67_03220 [Ktedonobacteraceae bacterium]|jgi:hypothetical protein